MEEGKILAIVTTDKAKVMTGGAPIFVAKDREEQQRLGLLLSRLLKAMCHDLENGVYIIIRQ